MTFRTRRRPVHCARHKLLLLRTVTCLLALAGAGIGSRGAIARAETVPAVPSAPLSAAQDGTRFVTSWAASVHAALARQATHAAVAARHGFTQSGVASWYGHDFAGKRTSSGVRFDPMKLTCAHRTLPLGTRLLVTSQETGRSVVVTVNDRGPYAAPNRIIDLSRAAANRIGMVQDGLSTVTLRRVAPGAKGIGDDVEVAEAADSDGSAQAIAAARR